MPWGRCSWKYFQVPYGHISGSSPAGADLRELFKKGTFSICQQTLALAGAGVVQTEFDRRVAEPYIKGQASSGYFFFSSDTLRRSAISNQSKDGDYLAISLSQTDLLTFSYEGQSATPRLVFLSTIYVTRCKQAPVATQAQHQSVRLGSNIVVDATL